MFQMKKAKSNNGIILRGLVLFFCLLLSATPSLQAANQPDLVVADIKFYASGSTQEVSPAVGQTITCKAILKNIGSADTGVFNVQWFLDGLRVGYGGHSSLAAGAASEGNIRFNWAPTGGSHTLKFVADSDNHLRESDEANNSFTKTVNVTIPPRPDLLVSDIKFYRPGTEQEITPQQGQTVTAKASLKNQGDGPTGVFNVKWFLDERQVGYGSHSSLGSGQASAGNIYFRWLMTDGNHTLRFAADTDNHVREPDKDNNAYSKSVLDTTAPVITITSPGEGEVIESDTVTLIGTVDNKPFSETRSLSPGENVLTKTATDLAGNNSSNSIKVWSYLGELIGPEGGEALSVDGRVKLIVPSGALTETRRISILSLNNRSFQSVTPQGKALLSVVECKPYGLAFNKPVSLIYTLPQAEIPGSTIELGLYDRAQDKIVSTGQSLIVPADGYTLNFSLDSFAGVSSTSKITAKRSLAAQSAPLSATYAALKGLAPQGPPIGAGVKIPLPDMLTGSFSHSIPITVPPGRKGIQPSLGLVYRSSNPNSWVGQGYSLNPGYIVRSTRLGPPTYNDTQDTFYFVSDAGTTELVYLIDNLYQAKVESSFTKFFKETDDSWRALAKDGSILRFGQASDSKEGSSLGTFSWYLTKAQDTNGNYIEYQYIKDQGKSYLHRIDYTGNENAGVSPTNSIEFNLDTDLRTDVPLSYISGAKIATAKRLKEIKVNVNSDLVWTYILTYEYSTDTNRSLLKSITQRSSDNHDLPTQTFTYQEAK